MDMVAAGTGSTGGNPVAVQYQTDQVGLCRWNDGDVYGGIDN